MVKSTPPSQPASDAATAVENQPRQPCVDLFDCLLDDVLLAVDGRLYLYRHGRRNRAGASLVAPDTVLAGALSCQGSCRRLAYATHDKQIVIKAYDDNEDDVKVDVETVSTQ